MPLRAILLPKSLLHSVQEFQVQLLEWGEGELIVGRLSIEPCLCS